MDSQPQYEQSPYWSKSDHVAVKAPLREVEEGGTKLKVLLQLKLEQFKQQI